jgi:hypothetical protein
MTSNNKYFTQWHNENNQKKTKDKINMLEKKLDRLSTEIEANKIFNRNKTYQQPKNTNKYQKIHQTQPVQPVQPVLLTQSIYQVYQAHQVQSLYQIQQICHIQPIQSIQSVQPVIITQITPKDIVKSLYPIQYNSNK